MAEARESWASSPGARRTMQSNRGRDTGPELAIRRLLHAAGIRYRVSVRPIPELRRTADMVLRPLRVAVFVDGCFWHRCPEHGTWPNTKSTYWSAKLERNVERDRDTDRALESQGWKCVRIWEHEAPEVAAGRLVSVMERKRHSAEP
jgi:DNA mismatch endonuclease (patch repair protein)